MFVTSTTYDGDLGGSAGADAKCNARAAAAGLAGTYEAWISGLFFNAPSRFDAYTRDIVTTCGSVPIADDIDDLIDGAIATAVSCDEFGATVAATGAWTGTASNGSSGLSCSEWGTSFVIFSGVDGDELAVDGDWTDRGTSNCSLLRRLYCIEQSNPVPFCGDAIPEGGEACDEGDDTVACDDDCTVVACQDGNHNAAAGEECDDGNAMNGDGCDSSCQLEVPVAWSCEPALFDDGNCHCGCGALDADCPDALAASCDQSLCGVGRTPGASDNSVCIMPCPAEPVPASSCRQSAKSKLSIANSADPAKDKLAWQWSKGDGIAQADLGAPDVDTEYRLCIWDSASSTYSLEAELVVAPSPTAWTDADPKGWKYNDKLGASDGVSKITLKTGADGAGSVKFQAKGTSLTLPAGASPTEYFTSDPKVVVQLLSGTGECWTGSFDADATTKNEAASFKSSIGVAPDETRCPTSVRWTVRADTNSEDTDSEINIGTTGNYHDVDPVDGTTLQFRLDCPRSIGPDCGVCTILGYDPAAGNCRCESDLRQTCDEPGAADEDDCGGNMCQCFSSTPVPMVRGLAPLFPGFCPVTYGNGDVSGQWTPQTGAGQITFQDRTWLYIPIGDLNVCDDAVCVGDPTANDGVRGGSCLGGESTGLDCDANGHDATWPLGGGDYSFDCLPTLSTRVWIHSHTRTETTGTATIANTLSCGGALNSCAGTCVDLGEGDGECDSMTIGYCGLTPEEDATTPQCQTNAECATYSFGTCDGALRSCLPNPLSSSGVASPTNPVTVSSECYPSVGTYPFANSDFGLPGPVRTRTEWEVESVP